MLGIRINYCVFKTCSSKEERGFYQVGKILPAKSITIIKRRKIRSISYDDDYKNTQENYIKLKRRCDGKNTNIFNEKVGRRGWSGSMSVVFELECGDQILVLIGPVSL